MLMPRYFGKNLFDDLFDSFRFAMQQKDVEETVWQKNGHI